MEKKVYCSECKWFMMQKDKKGVPISKGCANENTMSDTWYKKVFSDPAITNGKNDCGCFEALSNIVVPMPDEQE